mmetsp:Transcript_707/g.1640  ORF Transcript_707/g.1640 Transcript_707/m.1640 type:complete len:270 (-) Transcript_707:2042-2851(-)
MAVVAVAVTVAEVAAGVAVAVATGVAVVAAGASVAGVVEVAVAVAATLAFGSSGFHRRLPRPSSSDSDDSGGYLLFRLRLRGPRTMPPAALAAPGELGLPSSLASARGDLAVPSVAPTLPSRVGAHPCVVALPTSLSAFLGRPGLRRGTGSVSTGTSGVAWGGLGDDGRGLLLFRSTGSSPLSALALGARLGGRPRRLRLRPAVAPSCPLPFRPAAALSWPPLPFRLAATTSWLVCIPFFCTPLRLCVMKPRQLLAPQWHVCSTQSTLS